MRVDRQSSIYAAGEIAHLSYDAQISTNQKGMPSALRLRAYRSDPDGNLLGPAHGDPLRLRRRRGLRQQIERIVGVRPRARSITNRPLNAQTAFDRSRFEGDLPPGWEAEIYRNDELLGFAKATADSAMCLTTFSCSMARTGCAWCFTGRKGRSATREELINVGQDNVPPGKTWYWAGFNQPGRDIFTLHKPPDGGDLPKAQATVSLEHGIDDRTSVAALARMMLIDDQRVTFVEGTVRRSIGLAMIEVGAARETTGGTAARAQMLGKIGPVNVNAEALIANDFHLRGSTAESLRNYQLALDAPLKFGRTTLPAHADVTARRPRRRHQAARRRGAAIGQFRALQPLDRGPLPQAICRGRQAPGEFSLEFIGSGRSRRRAPARHHRRRRVAHRPAAIGGAVGLLVGKRKCRLGRRSGLRYGLAPGPRADFAHSAAQQHGDRLDRRSRD